MADDVGALVARVVADTEQFRSEMVRVSRQLETNTARMNRSLASVNTSVGSLSQGFRLATRVAAAFGLALSARQMASFVSANIKSAAELQNLSERLNASVESLSELQYVARITDIEFSSLTTSLQKMRDNLGDVIRTGKDAGGTFGQLGINVRELAAQPLQTQFITIAEALSRVENETVRASLAVSVFGKSGQELLQAMRGGAAGINALIAEIRSFGGVVTSDMAKASDGARDAIDRMKASVGALAMEMSGPLARALEFTANKMRKAFFPTTEENMEGEIDRRKTAIAALEKDLATREGLRDQTMLGIFPAAPPFNEEAIANMTAQLRELRVELELIQNLQVRHFGPDQPSNVVGLGTPGQAGREPNLMAGINMLPAPNQSNEMIRQSEQELTDFIAETNLARQRSMIDAWNASTAAAYYAAEQEKAIAQEKAAVEIGMREMVTNSALGLLHALGAKHRGAAMAALAIEKALAIKQIIVNTQAAIMKTFAIYGATPAGYAQAARLKLMGIASGAMVGATAFVQADLLSSEGTRATLGTSANPIFTNSGGSSAAAAQIAAGRKQKVVEIHVHGNVYGSGGVSKLAEDMRELLDDADVILFGPNSSQAAMLGG